MDLNKNNLNENMSTRTYAKHNSFKNFKRKDSLNSNQAINKILQVNKNTKILSNLSNSKEKEILIFQLYILTTTLNNSKQLIS